MASGVTIDLGSRYRPHSGQMVVHESPAKTKVLWAGRRWGKDRFSTNEAIRRLCELIPVEAPDLVPPVHIWTVVPNYPQGRQAWNELLYFIPHQFVAQVKEDENIIFLQLPGKRMWGLWEVKSADNASGLQTVGLDILDIREAQDVPDLAWERLRPVLTSAGRAGYLIAQGIPPTDPNHWFAILADVARRDESGDMAYFHFTSFDNPLLTPDQRREIEMARQVMTEAAWCRMYEAELPEGGLSAFGDIDRVVHGDWLAEPEPGHWYCMGVDLAKRLDWTEICVGDACCRRLVHHRRISSVDWPIQKAAISGIAKSFGCRIVWIDSTGLGDPIYDDLAYEGLPVQGYRITGAGDDSARGRLLNTLAVAIEQQTVSLPYIEHGVRQLKRFQPTKLPSGHIRLEAPPGEHDDFVFALSLMLWGCNPPMERTASMRVEPRRYLPTQAEAEGGLSVKMRARLAQQMSDKIRARADALGMEY